MGVKSKTQINRTEETAMKPIPEHVIVYDKRDLQIMC